MSSLPVDDHEFEQLYERYDREVYRYALALLRNTSEAEDVTQTTFLHAYRAIQRGERPQKPHNWLIAIAHNVCRSRVRFAMRRPREVPLDTVAEQLTVPEAERTNVRGLVDAIGRLPSNQRAAITMRELEGRSYPEIANALGVTVPAVESLLSRARNALRLQAAALRGLVFVQWPRSLGSLFTGGDATLGAAGAGAAAKAAALVAAGVLVGGAGYTAAEGIQRHAGQTVVPRLEPRAHAAAPVRVRTLHHRSAVPRRHSASPRPAGRATAPMTAAVASTPQPPATTSTPPPSQPAASTAAQAAAPAAAPTAAPAAAPAHEPVRDAVEQAVAALPVTVSAPPPPTATLPLAVPTPPPVPVPSVPVPTVTLPPPPPIPTVTLP